MRLTRTAQNETRPTLPGIGPNAVTGRKPGLPPEDLDGLQIQRARLALVVRADVIAEALADGGRNVLVPANRALFEAKVVAAGFLLDFAMALGRVE